MKPLLVAATSIVLFGCSASPEPAPTRAPLAACPTTLTGPTYHEGEVTGVEVWKASEGPHILRADVNVRDGAKLTIEACATVKVARDASLNVAFPLTPNEGELIAEGTAEKPIRFERLDDGPWGRIFIHHPGRARLAHVTLDGGGGDDTHSGESLAFNGGQELPSKHGLFVDSVTVVRSRGAGVLLNGSAAFASGSKALTIKESGSDAHPFPLIIGELAIDSVPDGSYKGNKLDEILIDPQVVAAAGGLLESATMRDRGVPYRVGSVPTHDHLYLSGAGGHAPPTLTIEPGVTLKMQRGTMIEVDGASKAPAVIKALGTKEKPIIFTSAEASPRPGDWRGFYFNGYASSDNRLEYVRIEYTGADCSCSLVTCSDVTQFEAAVIFNQQPTSPFIKNSVFAHGSGHGVVQGFDGASLDWRSSNSFEDLAGCPSTLPRHPDTSCPDPAPACK